MKATGIVRRIDDLGRVVIPKEIRRTMRIREGDPLEIYTTREGEVIFKKYSLINGLEDFAAQLCNVLSQTSGLTSAVTDRDTIIAAAGPRRRELANKQLSPAMDQLMAQRSTYCSHGAEAPLYCSDSVHSTSVAVAAPILCQGDVLGSVLLFNADDHPIGDTECKLTQMAATFLGHHMED